MNQWFENRPAFCRVRDLLLLSQTTRRLGRRRLSWGTKKSHINFLNKTWGTLVAHKLEHMSHNLMRFHTGCGRGCALKPIIFNGLRCTMMACCLAEQRAAQVLLQTPWSKCNKFKKTVDIHLCKKLMTCTVKVWPYRRKPLETFKSKQTHWVCVLTHQLLCRSFKALKEMRRRGMEKQ